MSHTNTIDRRSFLKSAVAAVVAPSLPAVAVPALGIREPVIVSSTIGGVTETWRSSWSPVEFGAEQLWYKVTWREVKNLADGLTSRVEIRQMEGRGESGAGMEGQGKQEG